MQKRPDKAWYVPGIIAAGGHRPGRFHNLDGNQVGLGQVNFPRSKGVNTDAHV